MGEKQTKPFQLSFNGLLKVDFQGSHVTSDGGLIWVRELDERLGLGELIDEHLSDSRQGTNKQFTLADLLRQSVYSRLAGYEDLNDAERVSIDPTFRLIGSQKIWDRGAALTSTLHGFETEMLASEENLLGLMALNRELVGQATDVPRRRRLRQAGDLQGVGGSRSGLRHSHPGQQEAGVGDRRHLVSAAGKALPEALGALQEFSLSGGELVAGEADRRQGRASPGRAVPAGRIHRDEHELAKPLGGTLLQQARGTPRKPLFWVPLPGDRWRIDWPQTKRRG